MLTGERLPALESAAAAEPCRELTRALGRAPRVLEVMEATIGGTRRHLVALATGLRQSGFTVEVAAPEVRDEAYGDTQFVPALRARGVPVHIVPMRRAIDPLHDGQALLRLTALMRRGRYDIVHTHSSKAGLLGRVAARLAGVPVTVHTPHGFYFLGFPSGVRRALYFSLEWLAARLCDMLIAVSDGEQSEALRHGVAPASKITVIRNGIDLRVFAQPIDRAAVRWELGIPERAPVVGTVARFTRQKAPERFLEAAAQIAAQRPDAVFVWCGDGELRREVEECARRLGLLPHLRLLGFRADVYRIMSIYDVFVLLSRFEGLAYTPMEAMALGKPVVGSDIAGIRDVVEHGVTGFLVPEGDPALAAQYVLELLAYPELTERLGLAGRTRVAASFDEAEMIRRTGQLYVSLLLSHRVREAGQC